MQARMHIAVDDAQPVLRRRFRFRQRAVDDVAHAILLRIKVYAARQSRGKVSSGLSAHMRDTMLAGRCGGIASSPSNCQCGESDANRNNLSEPIMSMISATPAASGGLSKGCVVTRIWSRMIAAGSRSIQGTSTRTPRQVLLARHMKAGSQLMPDSINTTFNPGNFRNTPS